MTERAVHPVLLIFDCDGVLVDSESIACAVEADYLTSLGMPLTVEDVATRFVGTSLKDMTAILSREFGARVPDDFAAELTRRTLERFATALVAIQGVRAAIESMMHPRCVASSSTPERIASSLRITGLSDLFDPAHVFSTSLVARGKPAPDVFLHAAAKMGAASRDCVVIEDSVAGVTGAVAAGMRCVGFLGGGHIHDKAAHADKLRRAGAHAIIDDMARLPAAIGDLAPIRA